MVEFYRRFVVAVSAGDTDDMGVLAVSRVSAVPGRAVHLGWQDRCYGAPVSSAVFEEQHLPSAGVAGPVVALFVSTQAVSDLGHLNLSDEFQALG